MSRKLIMYIMSDNRSGSTLLENILSKSDEIISVGELHNLHSHITKGPIGKAWNWKCSCGVSVQRCIFWSDVIYKTGVLSNETTTSFENKLSKWFSIKPPRTARNINAAKIIHSTYKEIFKQHPEYNVIIDSSKNPSHLKNLLSHHEKNDYTFCLVYIKRDLRAISLSKEKWIKKFSQINRSPWQSLFQSYLIRIKMNRFYKQFSRKHKMKLSYSQLATELNVSIQNILLFYKLNNFEIPDHTSLDENHSIGGSPGRFEKRKIAFDNSWKEQIRHRPLFNAIGGFLNFFS